MIINCFRNPSELLWLLLLFCSAAHLLLPCSCSRKRMGRAKATNISLPLRLESFIANLIITCLTRVVLRYLMITMFFFSGDVNEVVFSTKQCFIFIFLSHSANINLDQLYYYRNGWSHAVEYYMQLNAVEVIQ